MTHSPALSWMLPVCVEYCGLLKWPRRVSRPLNAIPSLIPRQINPNIQDNRRFARYVLSYAEKEVCFYEWSLKRFFKFEGLLLL
jgi:hypothetical protein